MIRSKRFSQLRAVCFFAALLFFSACAKPGPNGSNQTSAGASPEKALVTGASGIWKVTVEKFVKVAKIPSNPYLPPEVRSRAKIYGADLDQIQVYLVVEYLGAAGNVATPPAVILDSNGRRFEIITVESVVDPDFKSSQPTEAAFKSVEEFLDWLHPVTAAPDRKVVVKSRTLSTGEKFTFSYYFEDPKSGNLKLAFADVPPIVLPPAKDPEPLK